MPKPNNVSPRRNCSPSPSSGPVGRRKPCVNPPAPYAARLSCKASKVESIARPPSDVSTGRNGVGWPPLPYTPRPRARRTARSEEHTSELQSLAYLVCRLLLEKKKNRKKI